MSFTGTLLPYQPEAVDKMCERGSMLVAYDLGLGKTVLTIAAIERLREEGKVKSGGLVVCLSSLKYQWASQIKKFTDGSKVLVVDGTPKKREQQYAQAQEYDYIILNYEQVVNDWNFVSKLPRDFVILDEATAIKSFRSKRSKSVKKLGTAPWRFALTGTPIENGKPEELYSIMQFVDSSVLGRFDIFDQTFIIRNTWGGVERYRNLPTLHARMTQASVRKSQKDEDVAPYLPDAIHKDPMLVTFDRASAKLYRKIVNDIIIDLQDAQFLFGGSFNILAHYGMQSQGGGPADELRGKIMAKLGCLRMLCSHPGLLKISANKYDALTGSGSAYASELAAEGLLDDLTKTYKLDTLKDYVTNFLDQNEDNKVVIFCTFLDMVDMIVNTLGENQCLTYSGRLNAKTKEVNKTRFNEDPSVRVLVSSDAGGYGVDLPAANLLINYDLPWSNGMAVQRNGRINRASSEWPSIVVQDILIRGSIEERQYDMLQQKNTVASAVIDGVGIDDKGGLSLDLSSLNQFLQSTSV